MSLLLDPKFADCTIECGTEKWQLHKVVLCAKSKYFYKAFTTPMKVWLHKFLLETLLMIVKESAESIVKLDESEIESVRAMIQAIYTGEYVLPKDEQRVIRFHTRVFLAGDYYQAAGVREIATRHIGMTAIDTIEASDFRQAVSMLETGLAHTHCQALRKLFADIIVLDSTTGQRRLKLTQADDNALQLLERVTKTLGAKFRDRSARSAELEDENVQLKKDLGKFKLYTCENCDEDITLDQNAVNDSFCSIDDVACMFCGQVNRLSAK